MGDQLTLMDHAWPQPPTEPADRVDLVVLDPPRGKGRPRFGNGRAFTDAATRHAESAVRAAWKDAGRPVLPRDTALACQARIYLARSATHFLRDGSLSAVGRRAGSRPRIKPDVDNACHLMLDALEGYAYPADKCIVALQVVKLWTTVGDDGPRTELSIWALPEPE